MAHKMSLLKRKFMRKSEPLRNEPEKNAVRGHALFARFLERKGLADCVRFFPEDMTLGQLRSTTPRELKQKYGIHNAKQRERIMKVMDESHKEDQSDTDHDVSQYLLNVNHICFIISNVIYGHIMEN